MKIVFVLPLLGLALFCVYGFLASAEASDPSERLLWRSGYAVLGLVSMLGALTLLFGKRPSDSAS